MPSDASSREERDQNNEYVFVCPTGCDYGSDVIGSFCPYCGEKLAYIGEIQ